MKFDQDGWLDVAQEYNISGNSWDRGGITVTHLVIHGTAGGTNGGDTMAYMGNNGVSTHFAISTDGPIYQGVPCSKAAWGNAPLNAPRINFAHADENPNLWTISAEFCKPDVTNQIDITDAQKQSGFPLIRLICDTYSIPKRAGDGNGGIISHADINSIDRAHCPGTFPWDDLWTFLGQQGDTMGIPAGWKDDGTTLTAPNKVPVVKGFRDYILSHNWDPGDVPQQPEEGLPQLEQSNPSLGGGTWLPCLKTVLEWTSNGGVFPMYAGRELWHTRRLLKNALANNDALAAQVKALQQQITTPANVAQATQALNALAVLEKQRETDSNTALATIQAALTALGSH